MYFFFWSTYHMHIRTSLIHWSINYSLIFMNLIKAHLIVMVIPICENPMVIGNEWRFIMEIVYIRYSSTKICNEMISNFSSKLTSFNKKLELDSHVRADVNFYIFMNCLMTFLNKWVFWIFGFLRIYTNPERSESEPRPKIYNIRIKFNL